MKNFIIKHIAILIFSGTVLFTSGYTWRWYQTTFCQIIDTSYFNGKYKSVENGAGKWALYDVTKGERVTGFDFDEAPFEVGNNLASVKSGSSYALFGLIEMKLITGYKYMEIQSYDEVVNLCMAFTKDSILFLDTLGYEKSFKFSIGNYDQTDFYGFDDNGLCIVPAIVDNKECLALINKNGEIVTMDAYSSIDPSPYFINQEGDIQPVYLVNTSNDGWGVINEHGQYILQPIYSEITPADNIGFIVKRKDTKYLVDDNGNPLSLNIFNYIEESGDSKYIPFWVNDYAGILDRQGNIILEPIWSDVEVFNEESGIFCVTVFENNQLLINSNGEFLYAPDPGDTTIFPGR